MAGRKRKAKGDAPAVMGRPLKGRVRLEAKVSFRATPEQAGKVELMGADAVRRWIDTQDPRPRAGSTAPENPTVADAIDQAEPPGDAPAPWWVVNPSIRGT